MIAYQKLCAEFYDIDKPTAPPDELAFWLERARRANGPVLEPMCGSGRFLVPMLQAGIDIDGFDASPEMLARCRAKCATLAMKPWLAEQFLQCMEIPRTYDLAFVGNGSFGFLTALGDVVEALRRLLNALNPGGVLLIDMPRFNPSRTTAGWPWGGRWVNRPDGSRLMISWLGNYDAASRITASVHRYELIHNGQLLQTEIEQLDLRHFEEGEICGLFRDAGFVSIQVSQMLDAGTLRESDEWMLVRARRP